MQAVQFLLCLSLGLLVLSTVPSFGQAAALDIDKENLPPIQVDPIHVNLVSNSSQRCGETLTKSSSGIIYKPFENIISNERCVWIIGVPGARGYDINVLRLGSHINEIAGGTGLEITGVYTSGFWDSTPQFRSHAPNATGQFRVQNSNVVIVTFYATSDPGGDSNGFILEYNSLLSGNISGNTRSTHHISPPSTIDFKYPPGKNYTNSELATFVFPPKENIYTRNHVEHVVFRVYGLENNCYDSVFLYTLNATAPIDVNKYSYAGRICPYSDSMVFPHDDVALAIFQSDSSYTYRGFGYSVFGC